MEIEGHDRVSRTFSYTFRYSNTCRIDTYSRYVKHSSFMNRLTKQQITSDLPLKCYTFIIFKIYTYWSVHMCIVLDILSSFLGNVINLSSVQLSPSLFFHNHLLLLVTKCFVDCYPLAQDRRIISGMTLELSISRIEWETFSITLTEEALSDAPA